VGTDGVPPREDHLRRENEERKMEVLVFIGVALVAVLSIIALVYLVLVAMNMADMSEVGLVVLAVFVGLVLIAAFIWALVSLGSP
jgi:NADH:ubiquinone oxidoreductase subunit 3 (subunit A)